MARLLIREAHGGGTREIDDRALPYFPGWVVIDTLDDSTDASPLYLSKSESDFRYAKVTDIGNPNTAVGSVLNAAFGSAANSVTFITHGSDATVPRGTTPGRRFWIGTVKPAAFQDGVDLLVKPVLLSPAVVPTTGLMARYYAQGLGLNEGAAVTTWTDALGSYPLTAASAPVYHYSGGRGYVQTDGVDDMLSNTALTRSQPNTMVAVGKIMSQSSGKILVSNTATGAVSQTIGNTSGNWVAFAGSSVGTTPVDTNFHVFIATYNGASSELMIDGVVAASGNFGSNSATGLRIGGSPGGSTFTAAQVSEMLPYSRVLTAQEKIDVTASLRAFYGI